MKKLLLALFAAALLLPAAAFAQNAQNDQSKKTQEEQNQAAQVSQMGSTTMPQHSMTGMVGQQGKTLTSDNTVYQVNNPGALKNYDNQNVSVTFQFNTDSNTIHIDRVDSGQHQ